MAENEFGYHADIPESIREIFQILCLDVSWLHFQWEFYVALFGNSDNAALLSDMVRGSAQIIEESLRKSMTMAIGRLADPTESFKNADKSNCSLATLAKRCGPIVGLAPLLEEFEKTVRPFKKYRDKDVAHNDLATALMPKAYPLPGIKRSDVDGVLSLASRILNTIGTHYVPSQQWSFSPIPMGGGDTLMFWLKKAWDDSQQEAKRWLDSVSKS